MNLVHRANYMGLLHRIRMKALTLKQGRIKSYEIASELVQGKRGIEIGGPVRSLEEDIYGSLYISILDTLIIATSLPTIRGQGMRLISFLILESRLVKNIFSEGSHLVGIKDHDYDFVLSSHNLEHFANPVKALKEWQRITVRGGTLVLVLPYYKWTMNIKGH